MLKIILCDTSHRLTTAWQKSLPKVLLEKYQLKIFNASFNELQNLKGKEFNPTTTCVVSPGNSFGFLGGGFDLALYEHYGKKTFEDWFKSALLNEYKPIGTLTAIDTYQFDNNPLKLRYIQHIPTMVTPSHPSHIGTKNQTIGLETVFNTTWVALINAPIHANTIVIPGLCTGYAGVPIEVSCEAMTFAIILYHLRPHISKSLQNKLIMIYLGHDYGSFYSTELKDELNNLELTNNELIETSSKGIPNQLLKLL